MGKLLESHIKSPCQYSLRSRTKFGDPNEKSMNKTSANEPGLVDDDIRDMCDDSTVMMTMMMDYDH